MAEQQPLTVEHINQSVRDGKWTIRQGETLKRWLAQERVHENVRSTNVLWGTVLNLVDHYEDTSRKIVNDYIRAYNAATGSTKTPITEENMRALKSYVFESTKEAPPDSKVARALKGAAQKPEVPKMEPLDKTAAALAQVGLATWHELLLDPRIAFGIAAGRAHGDNIYNLTKALGGSEQAALYAKTIADVSTSVLFGGKRAGELESLAAQGIKNAFNKSRDYLSAPLPASLKAAEERAAREVTAQFEQNFTPENLLGGVGTKAEKAATSLPEPKTIQDLIRQFPERTAQQARGNIGTRAQMGVTETRAIKEGPVTDAWIQSLSPGTTLKAEQVVGLDRNGVRHLLDTWDSADPFLANPAGNMDAMRARMNNFFQSIGGRRATKVEAGRASQSTKMVPGNEYLDEVEKMIYELGHNDSYLNGNEVDAMTELVQKIKDLKEPGRFSQLSKKMRDALPTRMDVARGIYNNILLTGGIVPIRQATAVKKFLGDVYGQTKEIFERGAASYYKGEPVTQNEGLLYLRGLVSSYGHIGAFGGEGVTRGLATMHLESALAGKARSFYDIDRRFAWDFAGKEFGLITDFMQKHAGLASLYVDMFKDAQKANIKAKEIGNFAAKWMEDVPLESTVNAVETSLNTTFSHPVGAIGNLLRSAQKGIGWLMVPFAKIPANLANDYFSKVPVLNLGSRGFFSAMTEPGTASYYKALATNSMGLWLLQMGHSLQKAGLMTGPGPTDPRAQGVWRVTHEPNSMKIGNSWIQTNMMYPLGPLLQTGAAFAYFSDYFGDDDIRHAASAMAISVAKEMSDMPFLEIINGAFKISEMLGMGKAQEATTELGKQLVSPLVNLVGIVPGMGGPLGRSIAEIKDPLARHARGVFDQIWAASPLLRESLPMVKDPITGKPVSLPEPVGGRWFRPFHPFTMVPAKQGPGYSLMDTYGVKPPSFRVASRAPGPTGEFAEPEEGQANPITLTDEQRNDFIDTYANLKAAYTIFPDNKERTVSQALDDLGKLKEFQNQSVGGKQLYLHQIVNGPYHAAYQLFLAKHPDIATQVQMNRGEHLISQAPSDQQEQLRQGLDSDLKDYQLQLKDQLNLYQEMELQKRAEPTLQQPVNSVDDLNAVQDIYR